MNLEWMSELENEEAKAAEKEETAPAEPTLPDAARFWKNARKTESFRRHG